MASLPSRITDERRLRAVEASGLLDTGPEEAFDRLARLAVTVLGTAHASITLVDGARSFRKSAVGSDPDPRQQPISESFCRLVLEGGLPLFAGDIADDPRTSADASIGSAGTAAWAGVPLRGSRGDVLGCFSAQDPEPREWTPRDREVLGTLAAAASSEVALREARAAERDAGLRADSVAAAAGVLARTLQQSLLPPVLPDIPGLEIVARYHPAGTGIEVVGDFYDVFQSGREAWNIAIGDVMGKGIDAARVTALAHYTLRAAAMRSDSPRAALATLNRALLEQADAEAMRFLTAQYLTFTPGPHAVRLTLCSAGHELPLLKRADGATEYLEVRGTLLGAFGDPDLEDIALVLQPGDQLVLYTDGVIDAKRGRERLGAEGLLELVAGCPARTAADLAGAIETTVLDFNDGPLPDDAAVVVMVGTAPGA